ncbi:MAG: glycosyltransferase family 2 protein [Candidatus Omnitrophica bacterium]|nr:glycosyltransferase family 2 protein [Candidatus Omnitrophota bacterium]
MKVCVLIPAHNEQKEIGQLVAQIRAKAIDVIVVDDGSGDQTSVFARNQGAIVLRNEKRQGKGFSLKRGFAYILEKGYDGVIAMDGDGQHDPGDLEKFLIAAKDKETCLINGTRMRDAGQMPFVRRMTNRLMSFVISRMCCQPIEDTQCGYRYISADILKRISLVSNDFEIETEVLLKSCRAGCQVISVPVKTIYRGEKSKIHPIKDTIRFFSYLFWDFKNRK